jgi:uncharacterized protein YbbC (DUF1343 family)
MSPISLGIDQFLKQKQAKSKRWGLVTNDAVFTTQLIPVRQALIEAGYNIICLFSPEHGIEATAADGAAIPHKIDTLTGLPIYSLYGEALQPPPSVLTTLDGILFDLPDIGVRFYTYIWTLSHIMEACHATNLPLIVLDRPNPISGNLALAEGPLLDEKSAASFIGRWSMPIRHSLTIGELALYWQSERGLKSLNLTVIPIENWKRNAFFQDLNLPFIPTSPAISSVETLLTYPALCFLEGLNVSEGRGTAFPFRVCGAPWIDGQELTNAFNEKDLVGIKARHFSFTPHEGLYNNQACKGIMLHMTDRRVFRPIQAGLTLVALLKTLYPDLLKWANYPTNVNKTGERHFDLLTGTPSVRMLLEEDLGLFFTHIHDLTRVGDWLEKTSSFHIYEGINF